MVRHRSCGNNSPFITSCLICITSYWFYFVKQLFFYLHVVKLIFFFRRKSKRPKKLLRKQWKSEKAGRRSWSNSSSKQRKKPLSSGQKYVTLAVVLLIMRWCSSPLPVGVSDLRARRAEGQVCAPLIADWVVQRQLTTAGAQLPGGPTRLSLKLYTSYHMLSSPGPPL